MARIQIYLFRVVRKGKLVITSKVPYRIIKIHQEDTSQRESELTSPKAVKQLNSCKYLRIASPGPHDYSARAVCHQENKDGLENAMAWFAALQF